MSFSSLVKFQPIQWFLIICLIAAPAYPQSETANLWHMFLEDVTVSYRYSFKAKGYLPKPRFSENLKEMDGKRILISGYYLPVDTAGQFVLSYYSDDHCYFCGSAGLESIIEIHPREIETRRFSRLKTDDFIEVRGILHLNDSNNRQLFYVIKEAELIRIINH